MHRFANYLIVVLFACIPHSQAKEHPKNISQIWFNKITPGYLTFCGGGRAESTLKLVNKSDSFYQIEKPSNHYFFTPDTYDLEFECSLKVYSDGEIKSHKKEIIKHRIALEGGKVYDVKLKLRDDKKFEGCIIEFFDKYTQNVQSTVNLSLGQSVK
ncbi:hypothetical protein [Thalassomonas haliotis]|uniref:Uncharacterized protein n=1 Tax=Thalassomonas haliotis TaxID=485448 RepID=A0ABY7VBF0_9GAMM|nr:hypothetical protein [Thalassomonas haliotis]WDE10635.1 hypothetical protein H3N35_20605 [Thalassomonas haliotis]